MEKREIRRRFDSAPRSFYTKEAPLIEYKVAERALTHKPAEHLQKLFPRHHVGIAFTFTESCADTAKTIKEYTDRARK